MFPLIVILSLFSVIGSIKIGIIENNIIIGRINNSLLNITRDQCLCKLIQFDSLISALNYFQTNSTCQLFYSNNNSFVVQSNVNASLVFFNQSAISITTIQSNLSSTASLVNAFWSFDGDLNERSSNYYSPSSAYFFSPGITGYGSALYFYFNRSEYVIINSTNHLNISFQSFTFEFWVYPFSLINGDRGMIGQCQSLTSNKCLHMTIRDSKFRISFYNNSCTSTKVLTNNTWYHLAFVYDLISSTQMIYIDGIQNCIHTSSPSLEVTDFDNTPLTIGYTSPFAPYYFDGLIDQLSIVGWAKNSTEILTDATLVASYNFDNYFLIDSGPNGINGTGINITFDNNCLLLNQTKSYFQSSGFVLLGINNRSYSFSIWINPFRVTNNSILYIYQMNSNTTTTTWCLPFLQFNSQGQIQAQSQSNTEIITLTGPYISTYTWTHIVQTYSSTNGISLYINGTLFNRTSSSSDYRSGNIPLSITLGNYPDYLNATCSNSSIQGKQYFGWMDQFQIYSRELSINNVQTLFIR